MEMKDVVKALIAIGNESRLGIYRQLVQKGPAGMAAGDISRLSGIAPSSLSFHLKELVNAGLLEQRQEGRYVFYSARYHTMTDLIGFLTDNCCDGNPCMPVPTQFCATDTSVQDQNTR